MGGIIIYIQSVLYLSTSDLKFSSDRQIADFKIVENDYLCTLVSSLLLAATRFEGLLAG